MFSYNMSAMVCGPQRYPLRPTIASIPYCRRRRYFTSYFMPALLLPHRLLQKRLYLLAIVQFSGSFIYDIIRL